MGRLVGLLVLRVAAGIHYTDKTWLNFFSKVCLQKKKTFITFKKKLKFAHFGPSAESGLS